MIKHEDIEKKAKTIWEQEGRPQGKDKEIWLRAENSLLFTSKDIAECYRHAARTKLLWTKYGNI